MGSLFHNRIDAGRQLTGALESVQLGDAVVVGLARGGVAVAAEVARALALPLDALAVRKIGHPRQPEYALGAVTPGHGGAYVRSSGGLDRSELDRVIEEAKLEVVALDLTLHHDLPAPVLHGRTAVLVDDGLATGATMVAAVRWARGQDAARVVVAVPVGATESIHHLRQEADEVVCPHEQGDLGAVGLWYDDFTQVEDAAVVRLLREARSATSGNG